ncbi:MAG: tetratricopeptide repeat protein, partial [candidate division Zixibacteria bacterium]|nr:tetratricopeptide repeat protein [candidate division Zixibacteria bacterium]
PDYWEAHYYLGDCHYNLGYYDRAIPYYDRVLVLHSDPVWVSMVNYNVGVVYEKTGKRDRAVERYNRALKVKPGYVPAKRAKTRLLKAKVKDVEKRGRGRRGRDKD